MNGKSPYRPWREAGLLAALLLASELQCNVAALQAGLGQTRVTSTLQAQLAPLARHIAGEAAFMLGLTAVLTLLLCRGWAALAGPARAALLGRRAGVRAARLLAVALSTWAFVCAWLSLHAVLLPGSRLGDSWAARFTGAFDGSRPLHAAALVAPVIAALLVLAAVLAALACDAALRRRTVVLAAGGAVVVGGYELLTDPGTPAPFTRDHNVVLLGLDSFQANRLVDRPGDPTAAPHVAALLDECCRFDSAWTPLARTYPSWIAILSGRWPERDGVRFNLAPDKVEAPDNRYLGDVLGDAGYATLHATDEVRFSNVCDRHGFDELVHPEMGATDFLLGGFFDFTAMNLARQVALGHDLYGPLRFNRASPAYSPRLFVRGVLAALDDAPRDRPLFLAVHLCGDHWPFTAPAPYAWQQDDPVESCLAMVDAQVDALVSAFRDCGLLDHSLMVVLSDHGDGWSGPGDTTNSHGDDFRSLYANRAVLGLHGAGLAPRRVDTLVRTIDIYPTVLDALDLPLDEAAIDGRSLLPLARGAVEPPRPMFAETEVDRSAWSVQQLVERNARWYTIEPESGRVQIRDDGCREFNPLRQYLWIDGDRRLVASPHLRKFKASFFDPATGLDRPGVVPLEERERLIAGLARHFSLDAGDLLATARETGFLDDLVAGG